uniref:Uncharacterized protein n=1 Tax=Rhizophora mucronata TaxID=61149 RepID=A0A2P2JIX2_RHIMU
MKGHLCHFNYADACRRHGQTPAACAARIFLGVD